MGLHQCFAMRETGSFCWGCKQWLCQCGPFDPNISDGTEASSLLLIYSLPATDLLRTSQRFTFSPSRREIVTFSISHH